MILFRIFFSCNFVFTYCIFPLSKFYRWFLFHKNVISSQTMVNMVNAPEHKRNSHFMNYCGYAWKANLAFPITDSRIIKINVEQFLIENTIAKKKKLFTNSQYAMYSWKQITVLNFRQK